MNDKVRINDIEYIPVPNEIHLFGRTYVLDDCSDAHTCSTTVRTKTG